jgi:hypothetical protein
MRRGFFAAAEAVFASSKVPAHGMPPASSAATGVSDGASNAARRAMVVFMVYRRRREEGVGAGARGCN